MAPTTVGPKKSEKRVRLSIKQKYNLIQDFKRKKPIAELVKLYKCGQSVVYKVLKDEEKVKKEFMDAQNTDSKIKSRAPKYEKVDEMTYTWLNQAIAKKLPVSGVLSQAKAKQIADSLGESEFKASNGWLSKFKDRHNLSFAKVCGESNDVDMETVEDFREKLPEIIAGYDPKGIANCDETALFFRAIPSKTLCHKGEKCFGGKLSKERLTVMLCCFGDGSFEKPLVIGNRKMAIQKRKILLFLDNATRHPNLKLSNIELAFLPPNTTSHTQPLDQGIIKAFKVRYRTRILNRLLAKMDTVSNVSELVNSINVLDAIYWMKEAIDEMPKTVVPNCFRKVGFCLGEASDSNDDDVPLKELRVVLKRLELDEMPAEEYVTYDNDVLTESDADFTLNAVAVDETVEEDDENDDEYENGATEISHADVLSYIDQIKTYACKEGLNAVYDKIGECANIVQFVIISKSKQTTMLDFVKTAHETVSKE